ncbi:NaeI family type II restriction endonuclease [Streptomyces sp. NPDC008121]|uniref:NaeI family type II restriction endonuclease n=1 Tax=Streptomyces sp. NPDC008121 TaxID=3364809 RepID=UPI0036E3F950
MPDQTLPLDIFAAQNVVSLPKPRGGEDDHFAAVAEWLQSIPLEKTIGACLRQAIDEVLDGQRTGRFDVDDLEKTEKTYLGTKVEIIIRSALGLKKGPRMDYLIQGREVDSKFTIGKYWTIPREADGHICLLTSADDHDSVFRVGIVRINNSILNLGENRDGKRTLSAAGRQAVRWLVPEGKLPTNILMGLPEQDRVAIFAASDGYRGHGNGGQLRTNELFRRVQRKAVDRNTVLTVARQDDSPKRVRDARKKLRLEGIIILGHQSSHPRIARDLHLTVPEKGSWIAAKVTKVTSSCDRPKTEIDGELYAIAVTGETAEAPGTY